MHACTFRLVKMGYGFGSLKQRELFNFHKKEASLDKNKVTGIVPELDEFFKEAFRSHRVAKIDL